jgi:uncharacterized protein YutE (UPF0331/DUF86 family)
VKTALSRPRSKSYYEKIAKELEQLSETVRVRPEMNHNAAERLLKIANEIRADIGLTSKAKRPKAKR